MQNPQICFLQHVSPTTQTTPTTPVPPIDVSTWNTRLIGKRLVDHGNPVRPRGSHPEPTPWWPRIRSPSSIFAQLLSRDPTCSGSLPRSPLLALPPEIRAMIFKELFRDVKVDDWDFKREVTPAAVIFTCRVLYNEARDVARKACTFEVEGLSVVRYRFIEMESSFCDWVPDR